MQNAKESYNFVQINSKVGISNNKAWKVKKTYLKRQVHLQFVTLINKMKNEKLRAREQACRFQNM
jgi:hypothetical protein